MVEAHTLKVLEFGKILDLLGSRARTTMGKDLVSTLLPVDDIADLRLRLERVSAFKDILVSDGAISLEGAQDIRPLLKRAEVEGHLLEPTELLRVMETAGVAARTESSLARYCDRLPLAAEAANGLSSTPALVEVIRRSIEANGQVSDRATPRLVDIRKRMGRVRSRLKRHLESYLENSSLDEALQENVITLRYGRFVIPVKAERKGRVPGIIHDRSSSGATVFVEPLDTVEWNNELHEMEAEERAEIRRVLKNLTAMVAEAAPVLRRNVEILGIVDANFAAARLSVDLRAEPPVLNDEGRVRVLGGRHPLLEGRVSGGDGSAVPLDVELGGESRALVITGPNMGGKTVALKTVGLLTLMAQSGLHVPAAPGTELAVFDRVYADIGDEQSIEESLSTFSSHLNHLVLILDAAGDRTLVLLDELGVGTDPEEGIALGIAVMESLTDRDARVMATTHHGAFKIFADDHPRMENASLEFDPKTFKPTYRFRMGIPGASRGLDLADRLGVPAAVLDRARSLLGSDRFRLEAMLTDLEARLAELERERAAVATEREALKERNDTLQRRLSGVRREEKELREKALEDASRVVREAKKLVEKTVADLRAQRGDKASIKRARSTLDEAVQRLDNARGVEEKKPTLVPEIGDQVWIPSLGKRGKVVAVASGHVTVESDKLRLRVPAESLASPPAEEGTGESAAKVAWDGPGSVATEIDVRGFTTEDAIHWIDRFLDDATLAGLGEVLVIHGKGKGILKKEVETMLTRDSRVRGFRLGNWNEGGWGATVVTLH